MTGEGAVRLDGSGMDRTTGGEDLVEYEVRCSNLGGDRAEEAHGVGKTGC